MVVEPRVKDLYNSSSGGMRTECKESDRVCQVKGSS